MVLIVFDTACVWSVLGWTNLSHDGRNTGVNRSNFLDSITSQLSYYLKSILMKSMDYM